MGSLGSLGSIWGGSCKAWGPVFKLGGSWPHPATGHFWREQFRSAWSVGDFFLGENWPIFGNNIMYFDLLKCLATVVCFIRNWNWVCMIYSGCLNISKCVDISNLEFICGRFNAEVWQNSLFSMGSLIFKIQANAGKNRRLTKDENQHLAPRHIRYFAPPIMKAWSCVEDAFTDENFWCWVLFVRGNYATRDRFSGQIFQSLPRKFPPDNYSNAE